MNEVIIDGVNVAKCNKYHKGWCLLSKTAYGNVTEFCNENNNCEYKQLQRAKAENEKLKTENEHLAEKEEEARHYLNEAYKYKQALEDVREILNNYMGDGMVISFNNTVSARNMIKDKLDEVLEE